METSLYFIKMKAVTKHILELKKKIRGRLFSKALFVVVGGGVLCFFLKLFTYLEF